MFYELSDLNSTLTNVVTPKMIDFATREFILMRWLYIIGFVYLILAQVMG
jgi:hypothetical protein